MDTAERSVRSWIASENDVQVKKLVQDVSSGTVTFLDVVKALGEYLTSEDSHLRSKGLRLLSLVIERCPRDKLNKQAVRVLTTFYCSKLEDTETITPVLGGLSHLVTSSSFGPLEATDVISAIVQHVEMRPMEQSTRLYVYCIIDALLHTHRDHLKTLGDHFLSGYANLASGEKDPRNLLVAFKIAHVILTEFDISGHVESYFDIVFCYFPITFRPPPNDPNAVNTDDLISSLRACLSATPAFGRPGMALFLEKLSLAPLLIKREVLQTMTTCFPVYGIDIAVELGQKIWSALKLEIFEPMDSLTENLALNALRAFVHVLQSNSNDDGVDPVVQTICFDSLKPIGEPEKTQAKAGIRVLCTFVNAPSKCGRATINDAIKKLLELFHDPGEVSNQATIIMLLTDVLNTFATSATSNVSATSIEQSIDSLSALSSLLAPHKDAILEVLITGLKSTSTRLPAFHGLSGLIRLPTLLTDTELGFIVTETGRFVGKEPDEVEDITTDVISLLSTISLTAPHHLMDQTLPLLFSMLPDQAPSKNAWSERMGYWRALCALSKLCVQPTLFEILVIRLTAKLELLSSLCVPPASSSGEVTIDEEVEGGAAYAHALLLTLSNALSAKVAKAQPDPDVPKYAKQLLSHLFRLFLEAALADERRIFEDHRLLHVGALIIKLVVEALSIEQQQQFIDSVGAAFLDNQVKSITGGEFSSLVEFRPAKITADARQREMMILFSAAHIPIRKEVSVMENCGIPGLTLSTFLKNLVLWYESSVCSTLQIEAASQLFATLVNKNVEDISDFLDEMLTRANTNFPHVALEVRRKAIDIWVWISRGLLIQSHPRTSSFIDLLFTLLGDESVAWDAARAFGTLVANDGTLTKRNGAVVKILHVQKYASILLPKLIDGSNEVGGATRKTFCLVALVSLIHTIPKPLYEKQMPTIMPLLLRGLQVTDTDIRWKVIETLSNGIGDFSDDKLFSTYASTLVTSMLKNCTVVDMPEYKVRVAALKCLALLPSVLRYDLLHPYKSRVLKELAKALDDPKRTVRKEAVDARTKWHKYTG